jgi:hypothetical protein
MRIDPMFYMNDETLNALTVATPSAIELRTRSAFWRKFAGTIEVNDDKTLFTYNMVTANCSDMDAAADAMANRTTAEPVAVKVTRSARKATPLTAEQFWTMQAAAVQAIRAECGDKWYLMGSTVTGSLPSKLRSMIGPLGGKITWRRDHRFPAARYWPNGEVPVDVTLAPEWIPSADFYAPERDMERRVREARAEQIVIDRALTLDKRVDAALDRYWHEMDKVSHAHDGMMVAAYIKSVNTAADAVIELFHVDDPAEAIEQESRDDMDAERDAQILADDFNEQEAMERAARIEAERLTAECEAAELARAVRNAEYEDYQAAEQVKWNKLEREARDADRVMLAQRAYVAWWTAALDKAEVDAMIEASAVRRNRDAGLARIAREKLTAELQTQETARKAAEHAERKAAWESAQAARAERNKRPPVSSAFNAGRAALLAMLQDAAD